MKICSKCGETKPLNRFPKWENQCKDCQKIYMQLYRKINKEGIATKKKLYYGVNKEKTLNQKKLYYEDHKEKILDDKKTYYEENKEELSNRKKVHYENNKEQIYEAIKNWRNRNPEKLRYYGQKRRALKKGITATLTTEEWLEVWQEFNGFCFWCEDIATTMEHIVPLSPRPGELQGHHSKSNVVPACGPCNSKKNNMDPLEFYFRRQEKLNQITLEGAE